MHSFRFQAYYFNGIYQSLGKTSQLNNSSLSTDELYRSNNKKTTLSGNIAVPPIQFSQVCTPDEQARFTDTQDNN